MRPTSSFRHHITFPESIYTRSSSSAYSNLTLGTGKVQPPSMLNTEQEPAWLTRFLSDKKYCGRVLRELTERERLRAECRSMPSAGPPTSSSSSPSMSLPSPTSANKSKEKLLAYYSTSKASSSENATKNRYLDVLPYDRTSVSVNLRPSDAEGSSGNVAYLNASWVRESNSGIWWIAAQGKVNRLFLLDGKLRGNSSQSFVSPRLMIMLLKPL